MRRRETVERNTNGSEAAKHLINVINRVMKRLQHGLSRKAASTQGSAGSRRGSVGTGEAKPGAISPLEAQEPRSTSKTHRAIAFWLPGHPKGQAPSGSPSSSHGAPTAAAGAGDRRGAPAAAAG